MLLQRPHGSGVQPRPAAKMRRDTLLPTAWQRRRKKTTPRPFYLGRIAFVLCIYSMLYVCMQGKQAHIMPAA